MSDTITEYDVEMRYLEAGHAVSYATSHAEFLQLMDTLASWERVVDKVRAGGDPLICVMERE